MLRRKHPIAAITTLGLVLTCMALPQATRAATGAIKVMAQLEEGTGIGGTGGRHYPESAVRMADLNAS
jgi:hypothetical protein